MLRPPILLLLPPALITCSFTGCQPEGTSSPATQQAVPRAPLPPPSQQDCTQIRNQYQASDPATTAQMQGATGDEIRAQCDQKGILIPQG